MIQYIFFALLVVTLCAGIFSYFNPLWNRQTPLDYMMSGYNSMETVNRKSAEQVNLKVDAGLVEMRRRIEYITVRQDQFLDTLQDQQRILRNSSQNLNNLLLTAQKQGPKGPDILQLEDLASQLQNEQRLLVTSGDALISLNNQLAQNRELLASQINLANSGTQSDLNAIQQQDASFRAQASDFFEQVAMHNQQVQDQIQHTQNRLQDVSNNPFGELMLDTERGAMVRLAQNEERSRDLMEDAKQKLEDAQQRIEDEAQKNKDTIEDEHQKEEDQQEMIEQRIADERQQIQDKENQ